MELGLAAKGTTSPNPPVGAVIVDSSGRVVGRGHTQPVGGPHAEIMALRSAGNTARGGLAVVTLEPCAHTGRTGPCTQALINAGVSQVVFLHSDPNPVASGGAKALQEAGIAVQQVQAPEGAEDALLPWLTATQLGWPHVTLKFAQTLDGFTAATDGTSQWITGETARNHVHEDRARRDAIIIGTGTALADNPSLTARYLDGRLREKQPRRVVIGTRDISAASKLHAAGYEQYGTIDQALSQLWDTGARDVLVEGGASLAYGFLKAGKVDAIQAYLAPVLLGEGRGVVSASLAGTLADAGRWRTAGVRHLGEDVLWLLAQS
ncbi:bifunctional diaminohydroxyphosphoribosylaminopyrimidine deaminase/5-amino-6-(5-phosphoribosylamino)uracil reductase RibD [Corynebacterium phocae]|nr:bifunctional diaminohydroxyphosphoribosylaminopyrimidine deaminase/5-amino-6-(5-phosphoribosylamino)uracil reductase RibD [Corynebacterium phocae]KAA8725199.1 bifunctional diaminohydroxyphosphoribosylaminopyrimidine deaminase/5-amino-6-(5-phosphoribosylamino)uracil reductase RibD [Corynebacterium phocae]